MRFPWVATLVLGGAACQAFLSGADGERAAVDGGSVEASVSEGGASDDAGLATLTLPPVIFFRRGEASLVALGGAVGAAASDFELAGAPPGIQVALVDGGAALVGTVPVATALSSEPAPLAIALRRGGQVLAEASSLAFVAGPSGALDETFGDGGTSLIPCGDMECFLEAILPGQPALTVAGAARDATDPGRRPVVLRLDGKGSVDTSFGDGGTVRVPEALGVGVTSLVPRDDAGGVWLVASNGATDESRLRALDGTGAPLPLADDASIRINSGAPSLLGLGTGLLVATPSQVHHFVLSGQRPLLWHGGGPLDLPAPPATAVCLALPDAGVFVLRIRAVDAGATGSFELSAMRVDDAGAPMGGDGSPYAVGPLLVGTATSESYARFHHGCAATTEGAYLSASQRADAGTAAVVAHVRGDGSFDPAFGVGGLAVLPLPSSHVGRALAADSLGRALVLVAEGGSRRDYAVARLATDGGLDTTFASEGAGGRGGITKAFLGRFAQSIALDAYGRLLIVGREREDTSAAPGGANRGFVSRLWP